PHFREHADGSEAWDGVDLVEIDLAGFFLQEKIDAGHAAEFERAESLYGVLLDFLHLRGLEFGGNHDLRTLFEILRGVIIKFAVRDDFAGHRRLRVVVAEHGDFDLAGDHAFLDENFHGEFRGKIQRGCQFLTRVRFSHAHGRAEGGGFYENWVTEFQLDRALNFLRVAFPIVALNGDPRHDGDFRGLEQALGDVFVHGDGRAQYSGADKGQAGEIEEALNRAVFAKGAVHYGEDDIEALAASAAVQFHERGVGGVGGHHDALAALQNFRQHLLRASANEPVAFLGDADGHGFVLVGIEAANDGRRRSERDLVFAGAPAE